MGKSTKRRIRSAKYRSAPSRRGSRRSSKKRARSAIGLQRAVKRPLQRYYNNIKQSGLNVFANPFKPSTLNPRAKSFTCKR